MVNIDKNIPIPAKYVGKPRNEEIHTTLKIMEVGDSFEVETDGINSHGTAYSKSVGTFISAGRRHYKYKFAQRLSDDRKKIRLWRIE